jgi:hypothetical protein
MVLKTEDRLPYRNLALMSRCLRGKYRKTLYSAAKKLFNMGTCMCPKEQVHNSIDEFVEEIAKDADISETLKKDLWKIFRQVAVDGLDLRQDPFLEYKDLEESRKYLDEMSE